MSKHTPDWNVVGPELLEALERCAEYLGPPDPPLSYPSLQNAIVNALIRDARAAIAKAKGETP